MEGCHRVRRGPLSDARRQRSYFIDLTGCWRAPAAEGGGGRRRLRAVCVGRRNVKQVSVQKRAARLFVFSIASRCQSKFWVPMNFHSWQRFWPHLHLQCFLENIFSPWERPCKNNAFLSTLFVNQQRSFLHWAGGKCYGQMYGAFKSWHIKPLWATRILNCVLIIPAFYSFCALHYTVIQSCKPLLAPAKFKYINKISY